MCNTHRFFHVLVHTCISEPHSLPTVPVEQYSAQTLLLTALSVLKNEYFSSYQAALHYFFTFTQIINAMPAIKKMITPAMMILFCIARLAMLPRILQQDVDNEVSFTRAMQRAIKGEV